ncbi:hypothetical protein ATCC90586_004154 [Pythium insidiosum]|nr:hypothetical protein ATCC90586_004154 [Pythium insidiosum]
MTTAAETLATAAETLQHTASTAAKPVGVTAKGKVEVPRGRPVSGRPWKTTQKTRFSSAKYKGTKTLSTTWEEKIAMRAKSKELKELQSEIKARRQAEKDEKKRAREEREKRRAENELKSASVQVISRTNRLKSMSKKQLRNIRKTIVNKHGVVDQAGMRLQVLTALALSALAPALGGLYGVNYSVRTGADWAPSNEKCKSAEEIAQDLATLSRVTDRIRIYSLTDCNAARLVLPAAKAVGVRVELGLWVGADDTVFEAEKSELQALLRRRDLVTSSFVSSIHVGSEAVYRREISVAKSIELFSEIKTLVSASGLAIPVTIAEVGDVYMAHTELFDAVDFVSANMFPFWENVDIANAASHMDKRMERIISEAARRGKDVVISETGWASGGVHAKASQASPANAARYLSEFYDLARAKRWKYFYFAGFDNEWVAPDDVEAHFGIFHQNRTMKDEFRRLSFLVAPSILNETLAPSPKTEAIADSPAATAQHSHCS